ncbi:hypothetical protein H8S20_03355 [Clostridium sp. NSJ-6]|uniref:Uncharacterized protein n=1 Tax=Clostridium hominis TaxID=2763036 RepID=A0ABR7DB42_9CLOT|nr:hypothetical protein [Clostridium hominis]MBC5627923.1 hypothetical protein [Clostridium hominis]
MSPCGDNRKRKTKGKRSNIDLTAILTFIKLIQAIGCGMLGISILGLILVGKNPSAQVLYVMVIVVNLIIVFGGLVPIRFLANKVSDQK